MNASFLNMSVQQALRHIILCFVLLFIFASFETWTDVDMFIQQLFYDSTYNVWRITSQDHRQLSLLFYRGPKIALCLAAGVGVTLFILSFVRPYWRFLRLHCLYFVLSLALVPLVIASGKQITNIYCPKELTEFGGKRVYQRILEPARIENAAAPRGKGFPAGHSAGGFALMSLSFLGATVSARRFGLAAGLAAGWTMGTYQMLRGEHFLSHTLISMVVAWLLLVVLAACFTALRFQNKNALRKEASSDQRECGIPSGHHFFYSFRRYSFRIPTRLLNSMMRLSICSCAAGMSSQ